MKLTDLANYHRNPAVIIERHEEFVRSGKPFTKEALDFLNSEFTKAKRKRTNSFSASGLGSCGRQQQFTYLGWQKQAMKAQRRAVLLNGDFVGYRMQMIGLSEGYLKQAEVPIPDNEFGLKGTMDGLGDADFLVEYKSINDRGFENLKWENSAKEGHIFQCGVYLAVTGLDKAVILYENKNTQDLREFVVERDDKVETQILTKLHMLQDATDAKVLLPMLEPCKEKKGWQYDYCDYKDNCPKAQNWDHAREMADG